MLCCVAPVLGFLMSHRAEEEVEHTVKNFSASAALSHGVEAALQSCNKPNLDTTF